VIIIVCSLLAIATVPLTGGDLRRMGALPIRHAWLVWLAIATQTVLVYLPASVPSQLAETIHLATYALAASFAIANIRLPGVPLIAAGGGLNLAAILANGGVMPASAGALRTAGMATDAGFSNSAFVEDAKLAWLGDVFAIPARWPLANVFSIGDILVVVGVGYLAHRWCRREVCVEPLCQAQPESAPVS
jgi:hypothetical protein